MPSAMQNGNVVCPVCRDQVPMKRGSADDWVCPSCGIVVRKPCHVSATQGPGAKSSDHDPTSPPVVQDRPSIPFSPGFLAQYSVVRLLGRGGMGAVYLAKQIHLDRLVAVKVVKAQEITTDHVRRLLKEAKVLAGLNHPNILAVHDAGLDGTVPYIVCEYVEGETLADRLRREPHLSLERSLELAVQILDALHSAHERGVVHRDLKPANIFLTRDARPKIGDFGLAKSLTIPSGESVGKVLGTPPYMSPEQCRGRGTTPSSDLYAFGVILFEMATGRLPFLGPDLAEYLCQHIRETPPRARSIRADLPETLDEILDRALAKDPTVRYPNALEFRKALQGLSLTPAVADFQTARPTSGPPRTVRVEPSAGIRLAGRYELMYILGQGGMAQVWLAKDLAMEGTEVAVKLLPPELWADPESRANLVQEAKLSIKLSHPNIVRLMNLEPGDSPFLVMEYVAGPTLAEVLARRKVNGLGPMSASEVLPIVEGVAAALDLAHKRGIIHRDLKPSNVILETAGDGVVAKLADFGVAAEISSFRTRQTGMVPSGTLAYMSPEQVTCKKLDSRSDVYSLAATVYHALTFSPPFVGGDVTWAIVHESIEDPPGVPPEISSVLRMGLCKNRDERPATAGEFAQRFREATKRAQPGPSVIGNRTVQSVPMAAAAPDRNGNNTLRRGLDTEPGALPGAISNARATPSRPRPGIGWMGTALGLAAALSAFAFWVHPERPAPGPSLKAPSSPSPSPGASTRAMASPLTSSPSPIPPAPKEPDLGWKAQNGDANAQFELGRRYETGKDGLKDFVEAVRWYRKAATQGHATAQNNLGFSYANGNGVPKDEIEAVRWYRKAADQGYAAAQYNLGFCYTRGCGVPKNEANAAQWYRKAAEQGDEDAQASLGECYEYGRGVEKNESEAARWYRKAADQGHATAQNNLGFSYANGNGVPKDEAEAARWYRKAAEQGNAAAQSNLGDCYLNGQGVPKDEAEAARWYRKAAELGNAGGQFSLGFCYSLGKGVPKDEVEAARWYRKAAEQGHATAQNNLGFCYACGNGVPKDWAEAAKWYRKAAEQGIAVAESNLGDCYLNGQGVPKDEAEAARWYRKAADQGNTTAQSNVGFCLANGRGVPKNAAEAVQWYRKAADQGNAVAQSNLGDSYFNGQGVAKDEEEAVRWYRKAANQGNTIAQSNLGDCYWNGQGVPKDQEEAVRWYRKAAAAGNARAQQQLRDHGLTW